MENLQRPISHNLAQFTHSEVTIRQAAQRGPVPGKQHSVTRCLGGDDHSPCQLTVRNPDMNVLAWPSRERITLKTPPSVGLLRTPTTDL